MNSRFKALFAVTATLALGLTGCILTTDYREPAAGDTATLRIVNATKRFIQPFLYGNADGCRDRMYLPNLPAGQTQSWKVPAGTALAFTVNYAEHGGAVTNYCNSTGSYVPQAGKAYVLTMSVDGTSCRLQLDETMDAASGTIQRPVVYERRFWRMPLGEAGPFC